MVVALGDRRAYAAVMGVLLALFLLRVVGQIVVATAGPRWLPPMARWYSGLMPYRYLLPAQIVFLIVMTTMTVSVARGTPPLGTRPAGAVASPSEAGRGPNPPKADYRQRCSLFRRSSGPYRGLTYRAIIHV